MASPQKKEDNSLISAPGTPYAFSTALKPTGSLRSSLQQAYTQVDVAGRLSLGSVGDEPSRRTKTDKLHSPNESGMSESLGILDLDAMEDSGVSEFLASPVVNGGSLQLRLSVATSARSSIPPSNQMPAFPPPNQMPVFPPSNQITAIPPPNQMPAISPSNQIVGGSLDASGSSEEELRLSAGDLEQLDVTLTDESDHSTTPLSRQHSLSMPSPTNQPSTLSAAQYNPFDSANGSFSFGDGQTQEMDFSTQSQGSFLQQLVQDEREINLTPSESQLTSFSGPPQQSAVMSPYFREKSDQMGQLAATTLSPSQRPHFNDSTSHVILSPPTTASDASHVTTPTSHVTPPLSKSTPTTAVFNGITSSSHIPTTDIPPLDLTGNEQGLPSMYLNGGTDNEQGLPSMYLNGGTPQTEGVPSQYLVEDSQQSSLNMESLGGLPSQYLHSAHSLTSQVTIGSPSITPSKEHSLGGLPSQYLDKENTPSNDQGSPHNELPEDSTLVFPELSTLSSVPSELPYQVATPPSAYLPLGFEVTQVSVQPSFNESGRVTRSDQPSFNKSGHVTRSGQSSFNKSGHVTRSSQPSFNESGHVTRSSQPSFNESGHVTRSGQSSFNDSTRSAESASDHNVSIKSVSTQDRTVTEDYVTTDTSHVTDNDVTVTPDTSHVTSEEDHVTSPVRHSPSASSEREPLTSHHCSPSNILYHSPDGLRNSTTVKGHSPTNSHHSSIRGIAHLPTDYDTSFALKDILSYTTSPATLLLTTPSTVTATPKFHTPTSQPHNVISSLIPSQPLSSTPSQVDVSVSVSTLPQVTSSQPHTVTSSLTPSQPHTVTTIPPLSPLDTSPPHTTPPSHRAPPTPDQGIPPKWLEVCPSVVFSPVVCGDTINESVEIANRGDRWIQVTTKLTRLCRDTREVSSDGVFTLTQRLFIGPGSKEQVKVTFAPQEEGQYSGIVSLYASLVVSSNEAADPLTTISLEARAEPPKLQISAPSTGTLDYGTVVGGSTLRLPVELVNNGSSALPLRVTVTCEDSVQRMYFTVQDGFAETPLSPRSHPHSITLSLPPHPHNKPHPLHVQFSAPKLYNTDSSRAPLTVRGGLEIAVDNPHTPHTITSLSIHAVVGVAKLLAPGAFQSNDYTLTCMCGSTKTERVPLKNAGNMTLTVLARVSQPALFLVSPATLTIQPGQESYVDVTFAPTSDPVTSDVTLMLHVDPNGPDYNLRLRGVAIRSVVPEVTTPRTLSLPDTKTGECSKERLEISNPGPVQLQWTLIPAATPFLKKTSGDLFKVNYPVFQTQETNCTLKPHSTDKVSVLFQPQEEGQFSQIWELKVTSGPGLEQKINVSFGGCGLPSQTTPTSNAVSTRQRTVSWKDTTSKTDVQKSKQISQWLSEVSHSPPASQPPTSHPHTPSSHSSRHSPSRRSVYIREEEVTFPPTPLNTRSTVKVQVCNRDLPLATFTVLKPTPPFSVDHRTFKLGSRQCARLPIHFCPSAPGKYQGIVALRTENRQQMFVVVRGESPYH